MKFGHIELGQNSEPLVVAELSGNHNGSLNRALEIVDAIGASGAQVLKLQTYTAETMTLNIAKGGFVIDNPSSLWHGRTLYSLYHEAHTPWEWHKPLFDRARKLGLVPFSSPFDTTAVDLLESLDAPAYKIASFENRDHALIRRVARTGKPVVISTGLATIAEVQQSVLTARKAGCNDIVLLKCTSNYPASAASSNLRTLPHLRALFDCEVGLSDHTLGIAVAIASVALGAVMIEKHVTMQRSDGGVDSAFSLEPAELKQLVESTRDAWRALGRVQSVPSEEENASLIFRRSLYVCTDLAAQDILTTKNLRAIRPGYGLSPEYLEVIIGKRVKCAVSRGTPLTWELIG